MSEDLSKDFIRQIIDQDILEDSSCQVVTRFPPEPNGFLHLGHAKSICLNFGVAAENNGITFLRFDDTNPTKENEIFAESIKKDVTWLGFDWGRKLTHASDYFEQFYLAAISLIEKNLAYVDESTPEEIKISRGTLTKPGIDSPFRNRSAQENLDIFKRMRNGEFSDGKMILRAKIDMASPNMNLRDPAIYRIRHYQHQRTADKWCIYPMYDFAHALSDAFEGITYSLCTLEFEDHRPLYNWFVKQVETQHCPRQIEFSRLNLAYSLTSKRKLNDLIEKGVVDGWDDPRLVTISGMKRRGYPASAILDFCKRIGVTKKDNIIEMGVLENCVRKNLGDTSERRMGVLKPLKVTLSNYDEGQVEYLDAQNHPNFPDLGIRKMPFCRELYIESSDFLEDAPRKFFRLKPGGEVRLRYAYIIRCDEVIKNSNGEVIELICSYDVDTKSGTGKSDKKVKGTIHWVSAQHSITSEVRLYDRLFKIPDPANVDDIEASINPHSLEIVEAELESSFAEENAPKVFQLERNGYFCLDNMSEKKSFNRVVTLRDSWAKIEKQALNS
tara:strand:+ start:261 stop:1928 length:1668 start_codon:yes stop_codon:yes gene_type:complete